MTICIAAVCDSKSKVIVACDRMITVMLPPQEFEHGGPKLHKISDTCVATTAGSVLAHVDICENTKAEMADVSQPSVKQIVECITKNFVAQRKRRVEDDILKPRGFDLKSFYEKIGDLPPQIGVTVDSDIMKYDGFSLEILIAGVDRIGAHIYEVTNPGGYECFDSLGYDAIGSGEHHAIRTFIFNNYSCALPLKRAIFSVYEAKRWAENAPGVGKATDMCVVDKQKVTILSAELIEQLEAIYEKKIGLERSHMKDVWGLIDNLKAEEGITSSNA